MNAVVLDAYSKINLHLDVVSKESNGYHGVVSVMQTLSLCDRVSVALSDGGGISLECDDPTLPCNADNLAWRAAEMFFENYQKSFDIKIAIEKRIPIAGGMAGGSTDAAAVMVGLNTLAGDPFSLEALCEMGAKLGADVPFCIAKGTKYAYRYGDLLSDMPSMPHCYIAVACGGENVSTPTAYSLLDGRYSDFREEKYTPRSMDGLSAALAAGDLVGVCENTYNIFESVIEPVRPCVSNIKRTMLGCGALCAMMSGSGPSVFGIFDSKQKAEEAVVALSESQIRGIVCEPVNFERF